MADPIIPSTVRVQVVLQYNSGLPEDVSVNSWAFSLSSPVVDFDTDPRIAAIALALDDYYTTSVAPATATIADYLAPYIDSVSYRFYDLGETPPRTPFILPRSWSSESVQTNSMPGEVAIVSSFYSVANRPRQRGRLYHGPWAANVTTPGIDGQPIPRADLVTAIVDSANRMADFRLDPDSWTWVVISQMDAAAYQITDGWVDNAFDTQRRRGRAPYARTTWIGPPPD